MTRLQVRRLTVKIGSTVACHDLSDGGLGVALAEMAMAGEIGAKITPKNGDIPLHAWLFGEDQGRYVLVTNEPETVLHIASDADVSATTIGSTGGASLSIEGAGRVTVAELIDVHQGWFPTYMA